MKTFNIIFENCYKKLITEGGLAFNNVSKIKKEIIALTIDDFKKKVLNKFFGFDVSDTIFLLGSTGKKKFSGDIDIAVDVNGLNEQNVLLILLKLNKFCVKAKIPAYINVMNQNLIHICYPQIGNYNKNVQIDLLFTKYPEFTKFFMYSPEEGASRYKAAHRNTLFNAILYDTTVVPLIHGKDDKLLKWRQTDINFSGISKSIKTLIDDDGNLLTYKNSKEPLEIPYAQIVQSIPISHSVDYAINLLVGNKFKSSDIDTFEKLYDIVSNNQNFKYRDRKDWILKIAKEFFSENDRIEFPAELR